MSPPNVSVSGVKEYRDIRRRRGCALGRSAEEPAAAHSRLSRSRRQVDGGWGRLGHRRDRGKTHPLRGYREWQGAAQPQPLIACHDVSAFRFRARGPGYQVHVGDSCNAQFIDIIAGYRNGWRGQGGPIADAKSKPAIPLTVNEMLSGSGRNLCQRLTPG